MTVAPVGARCCDVCEPEQFTIPLVEVEKIPGLKGGKKRKWPTELSDLIRTGLRKWSREVLMPQLYPSKEAGFSMTGSALLPDSTIEQLAMCGERVDTVEKLRRRARWFLMPIHGQKLLEQLQCIFQDYDASVPETVEPDPPGDIFDAILDAPRARGRGGRRAVAGGRTRTRGRGSGRGGRGGRTAVVTGPPRRGRSAD